jgi:hypothetical protein
MKKYQTKALHLSFKICFLHFFNLHCMTLFNPVLDSLCQSSVWMYGLQAYFATK